MLTLPTPTQLYDVLYIIRIVAGIWIVCVYALLAAYLFRLTWRLDLRTSLSKALMWTSLLNVTFFALTVLVNLNALGVESAIEQDGLRGLLTPVYIAIAVIGSIICFNLVVRGKV